MRSESLFYFIKYYHNTNTVEYRSIRSKYGVFFWSKYIYISTEESHSYHASSRSLLEAHTLLHFIPMLVAVLPVAFTHFLYLFSPFELVCPTCLPATQSNATNALYLQGRRFYKENTFRVSPAHGHQGFRWGFQGSNGGYYWTPTLRFFFDLVVTTFQHLFGIRMLHGEAPRH
jgi:hypothetical protein